MTEYTMRDGRGKEVPVVEEDGIVYFKSQMIRLSGRSLRKQIDGVRNMTVRDDDILIAAYPKAGTHWTWEIVSMLVKGQADYEIKAKETAMLDYRSVEEIEAIQSPRVLNTHYPSRLIPKGIIEKRCKIIHVQRNVKDAAVSYYHHCKEFYVPEDMTFSDFLPLVTGKDNNGKHIHYSWFDYVKEWEIYTRDHLELDILNLYYEDMQMDSVGEVKKLSRFLGFDYPNGFLEEVADKCSFHKLQKANTDFKQDPTKRKSGTSIMYRKGNVSSAKKLVLFASIDSAWLHPLPRLMFSFGDIIYSDMKARPSQNHLAPPNSIKMIIIGPSGSGQVGDWKNWFTVAENEYIDTLYREKMTNTNLKFTFTI